MSKEYGILFCVSDREFINLIEFLSEFTHLTLSLATVDIARAASYEKTLCKGESLDRDSFKECLFKCYNQIEYDILVMRKLKENYQILFIRKNRSDLESSLLNVITSLANLESRDFLNQEIKNDSF